jgi:Family of unknown function (DUF6131)
LAGDTLGYLERRSTSRDDQSARPGSPTAVLDGQEGHRPMIAVGVILLIVALLIPKLAVLWAIGIIVLIVGLILAVLGGMGRAVGGRRHYY